MIIRKATVKDIPLLVGLWKEFMKDHDRIVIRANRKVKPYLERNTVAVAKYRKFITKNVKSRDAIVFIAEIDGKPAGYNLNMIEKTIPIFKIKRIGYISDLFVRKPYRGKGVSTAFIKEAIRWFKKKGMKHVSLKVQANNKARKIYQKWGFMDYHIEMRKKI
jgi:GNAT superfamily N-acetyltransferase